MIELKSWPVFGLVEPQLLSTVKIACVFGNLGQEAIFVTRDDEVYSLGSNASGCLGIEPQVSTLTPTRVELLCQKRIKGFAYGTGPHVLAFTEDGTLYAWGHNGFCQLGLGSSLQIVIPTLVGSCLATKKVEQIACGSHHSIVLTSEGEVYSFGQNSNGQVGCGSTANQPTPRRVSAVIGTSRIVSIACSQTSSFAVSETGELFSWGYNGTSNLGLGSNVNQYNPQKVIFTQSVHIKKVACGSSHTLALGHDGSLWSFGANLYGQLGTGNKANVGHPIRIAENIGRIIDIAASQYSHLSVAQTHVKVYVFGQCRGQSVTSPMETPFKSMHEAFACFSTPQVTYAPIEVIADDDLSISQAVAYAFDDAETSDVQFSIDGKTICAHKAILRIRCEHFRCMFNGKWEETQESIIPIDLGVSYNVFRAFLQYLYTDEVNLSGTEALDLLKLANYYCEARLRQICGNLVKQSITIENACKLYESSIQYNANELKEFTFRFILHNLTQVVNTDGFQLLDGDLIKELCFELGRSSAFKY